jgi:hypothetical protein
VHKVTGPYLSLWVGSHTFYRGGLLECCVPSREDDPVTVSSCKNPAPPVPPSLFMSRSLGRWRCGFEAVGVVTSPDISASELEGGHLGPTSPSYSQAGSVIIPLST